MSYNGSGTFVINSTGQPVVTGTVISSTAFNALTSDLATGLSTAITKDGQTATTARIPFAQGISSTLVTDSTSTTTGSIITAGGAGVAKALFVGTTANVAGAVTLQSTLGVTGITTFSAQPIFSSLTASSAVATDASKGLVSVTNTGTGNNVLATSPTLVTPVLGAASATSVTVAAGAVGTPSITTAGDTNTGIFFPAADTIAFSEGGAEAMRITSAGLVGIGTTSPIGDLTVSKAGAEGIEFIPASSAGACTTQYYNRSGAAYVSNAQNASVHSWLTSGTESARIDSGGNLLINETSRWRGGGRLSITTGASDGINILTGSAGIIIRKTSYTNDFLCLFEQNSGTTVGSITTNGTITVYNTTSDYRLKTVVGAVTGHGERIDALEPVEYTWNSNGLRARGFLAHKFQEVYADSVTGTKDAVDADGKPAHQGMQASSSEVIADLVAEIQSLRKRITALEAA